AGKDCAERTGRTAVLCYWDRERQRRGQGGSHLAHQQRTGRGPGDEIEADQATNVWEGRISSPAQAGTSCGVADSWSMREAVQAVWSVLCVVLWEELAGR